MPRTVLLTAPWKRAWLELRHRPGLLAATAATGLTLGLVSAAPLLFVSTVGAGAVQVQYARQCPASIGPTFNPDVRRPGGPAPIERFRSAVGDDPVFAPVEHIQANYSALPVRAGEREANIGFLVRPTFRDHVEMLGPEAPGDVWIPDTLQRLLAADPGDRISVQMRGGRVEQLTVAGVFRDLAAAPLDSYWCAATAAIVPQNMYGEIFPPPMAIVEADTFEQHELGVGLYYSRYVAEFAVPPETVADATRLARSTATVAAAVERNQAADSTTASISRLERRARLVREAIRETTIPVAVLAVVCALALAAVLGLLWVRARRNSCIALSTLGVSPAALGAKAAMETGVALVGGTLLGAAAARWSLAAWAPATDLEPNTMRWAILASLSAAALGLVLVAGTAALASRSLLRVAAPASRGVLRFVPFELLLLGVAWYSAQGLAPEAIVPIEGRRVVDTSAAVLVLPLAILGLGGALAGRLWWWLTRRSRSRHLPAHLSLRLALRRLQFGSKAGTAILGAGTLALGVSVFGLTMNSSLERTGVAKSAVFVGSDVRILIAGRLPPGTEGATEVWMREEMEYDGQPVDVIAIDPGSFADVAFWDASFADRSLTDLVALLEDGSSGFGVIGVGELVDAGELSNPNNQQPPAAVEVIHRSDFFPGAGLIRPTLIMTIEQARRSPITFRHFVWARGAFQQWRTALQELGAQPMLGISRIDAVDSSVLVYAGWAFDFVKALGIFVGVLVAAALLLHLAIRQRQQALGFAFLRRMGFGHRRHWWALVFEVGGLLLAVFALGSLLALLCVRIVSPNVDPLPRLPPGPLMAVPWWSLATVGSVGIALVVLGSSLAQGLGARVDVAEVLRDGT